MAIRVHRGIESGEGVYWCVTCLDFWRLPRILVKQRRVFSQFGGWDMLMRRVVEIPDNVGVGTESVREVCGLEDNMEFWRRDWLLVKQGISA